MVGEIDETVDECAGWCAEDVADTAFGEACGLLREHFIEPGMCLGACCGEAECDFSFSRELAIAFAVASACLRRALRPVERLIVP